MPAYEICYLDEDGALTYKFSANCDDDQRAKILAHAMKTAQRQEAGSVERRGADLRPAQRARWNGRRCG